MLHYKMQVFLLKKQIERANSQIVVDKNIFMVILLFSGDQ